MKAPTVLEIESAVVAARKAESLGDEMNISSRYLCALDDAIRAATKRIVCLENDGTASAEEVAKLRKVADAAAALVLHALSGDGDRYQRDMPHYDALFIALKEAGR